VKIAFTAAALFTPLERIDDAVVLVEDGSVAAMGPRAAIETPAGARPVDLGRFILAPGFIDIHIHGAAGYDVMRADEAGMAALERLLAQHGVTGYLPTTVTASLDSTLRSLERLGKAVRRRETMDAARAASLGVHLEGPFISHAKRGVHPEADILEPDVKLLRRFWEASQGNIRMMTMAPEVPGADEMIAAATGMGICVSLGHSNSDLAHARAAIRAGARHATHTFNAMRPLTHREPGLLGAILTDRGLTADLIADGIHVDPTVVQLFLNAKGPEGAVLITDAISATGMPDGRYQLGSFDVELRGGRCTRDGRLAGSVLTMDQAVRNVMQFAGWGLQSALRLATFNPAHLLSLDDCKGTIALGSDADFVVLTPEGKVVKTIVRGVVPNA